MRHISAVLALFLHVLLTKLLSFFLISEKVSAADLAVLMQFNQIANCAPLFFIYVRSLLFIINVTDDIHAAYCSLFTHKY